MDQLPQPNSGPLPKLNDNNIQQLDSAEFRELAYADIQKIENEHKLEEA